jgi:hypothetical protein
MLSRTFIKMPGFDKKFSFFLKVLIIKKFLSRQRSDDRKLTWDTHTLTFFQRPALGHNGDNCPMTEK